MFVLILVVAVLGLSHGVPVDPPASPSDRIHGGVDAPPGFAPHMAALLYGSVRVRVVCGASIVTRRHLLTAAHCVTPFIIAGELSMSFHGRVGSNNWQTGGTLVQYCSHHIHPEWDEDTIKNDVAILELTKELVLNEKVAVIGLEFGWVGGGELSYVTGWGTMPPKIEENVVHLAPTPYWLQLIEVFTLAPWQCYKSVHSYPPWSHRAPPLNGTLEICTFHSVGHGMCHGDSGSALVSLKTGCQIGIVSWGFPCAVGAPDFCARIKPAKNFILSILGKFLDQHC